jgi:hypothetical protein
MPWVRVEDNFYDHDKFVQIGPLGLAVWITGLAYCNRNLTNGVIPESVLRRLVDFDGLSYTTGTVNGGLAGFMESDCTPLAVHLLIEADLVHEDEHDCPRCDQPGAKRLIFHDYTVYQPTREQIRELHEQKSQAGREGAKARWGKAPAKATAKTDAEAPAIAGAIANGWQNDAPNPNPKPLKTNTPPTPRKRGAVSDEDEHFSAFWDAYPRRVGKGQARKAWGAMLKKDVAPEAVVKAAQDFANRCTDTEERFIPHPSTWLNGERWTDEAPPPQRQVSNHDAWKFGDA